MENEGDTRNKNAPKNETPTNDKEEFIPVITYVYRDDEGNEFDKLRQT